MFRGATDTVFDGHEYRGHGFPALTMALPSLDQQFLNQAVIQAISGIHLQFGILARRLLHNKGTIEIRLKSIAPEQASEEQSS